MYKITLDLPGLPKGEAVTIDGIGELRNGESYDVSAQEAEAFRLAHPRPVEGSTAQGGETVVETQKGPTLLEAFKGHEHITVEKVGAQQNQEGGNA